VLFRQDPRWLGADGAHSIRLDNQRIFWTFADTFVSTSNAHVRHESAMVRNTIAIQTGNDPLTATMKFYWQQGADGSPASFFPEDGQFWYWPQARIRLDEGPLVTFLYRIVNTPEQGLGFDNTGYAISIVENPDAPPGTWKPEIINARHGRVDAFPATALTGPWSAPVTVYRPPESAGPRPFVYGAVAHPALVGQTPEDLIITYTANSFEFTDMFTNHGSRTLYWPRVISVSVN